MNDRDLDLAQNIIAGRCRYCGVASGEYHDEYCNVVLAEQASMRDTEINFRLSEVARRIDEIARDLRAIHEVYSQRVKHRPLFFNK